MYTLTNVGQQAIQTGSNSPALEINIGSFKIYSAVGSSVDTTITTLPGTLLYTGIPKPVSTNDTGITQLQMVLDKTVGTWDFGTIGIYLSSGELFAYKQFTNAIHKVATPNADANELTFTISIQFVQGGTVNVVNTSMPVGYIPRVVSVDNLPKAEVTNSNIYVTNSIDANGNNIVCSSANGIWNSFTHPINSIEHSVDSVAGSYINSSTLSSLVHSAGKYLAIFTNGSSKGFIRLVNTIEQGKLSLITQVPGIKAGDKFKIVSNIENSTAGFNTMSSAGFNNWNLATTQGVYAAPSVEYTHYSNAFGGKTLSGIVVVQTSKQFTLQTLYYDNGETYVRNNITGVWSSAVRLDNDASIDIGAMQNSITALLNRVNALEGWRSSETQTVANLTSQASSINTRLVDVEATIDDIETSQTLQDTAITSLKARVTTLENP